MDYRFEWESVECASKTYEDNLKTSNESTYKNIRNIKKSIICSK